MLGTTVEVDRSVELKGPRPVGTPVKASVPGPYTVIFIADENDEGVNIIGVEVRKDRPTILPPNIFINVLDVTSGEQRTFDSMSELKNFISGGI